MSTFPKQTQLVSILPQSLLNESIGRRRLAFLLRPPLGKDRLDHRQVETRRHPVIEKARVTQDALFVVEIFLVQGPSDSLSHTALHLPFDVARMDGAPRVLRYRGAQYLHLARILVDLDVDAYGREGIADRADGAGIYGAASRDRAARARELRREFLQLHRRYAVPLCGENAAAELDFLRLALPQFCGALLELAQRIVSCLVNRQATRQRDAAATSDVRIANRVRVRDQRPHVGCVDPEQLRRYHRHRSARTADIH